MVAGRFRFFEKGEIVVVCGGIGAEAARRAAEAVIAIYAPKVCIRRDLQGRLIRELKVGDIVLPRRVVNAGDGSSVILDRGEGVLVSYGRWRFEAEGEVARFVFSAGGRYGSVGGCVRGGTSRS